MQISNQVNEALCGSMGTSLWLHDIFSPCFFESTASLVLLKLALVLLVHQRSRLKAPAKAFKGPNGTEGSHIGLTLFLSALHLLHTAVAVALLRDYPFHILYNALLAAVWLTVSVINMRAIRAHQLFDCRILSVPATAIYLWSLITYYQLYFTTEQGLPLSYIKAAIWTDMLQVTVATVLAVIDFRRKKEPLPSSQGAAAAGGVYQPLVDGDVESGPSSSAAGKDAGEESESRTWISLFADACSYVWPEDFGNQLRTFLCLLLLIITRFLNLAVPICFKHMVDTFAAASQVKPDRPYRYTDFLWPWMSLYLVATFFQGGAGGGIVGFINNLRQYLWIPVSQDAYRRISLRVFDHVLGLDLNFHLKKKTGETTKIIDRGTNAIQNILSTILFSILPQMIDVLAAATYLAQALEPTIAIIVFITVGSYIPVTIYITEWRGNLRREMNQTDQAKSARITDALLNYETVKYFTNEKHENAQYARAIGDYQGAEYKSYASMNVLNVTQSLIMFVGVASGLFVCARGVYQQDLTAGDVVLFISLMAQLYGPLNFFGTYYRTIQQYMIDMENLMDMLDKQPGVTDWPGAKDLVVREGKVEYDHVSFNYEPRAPVLQDVSFNVEGGHTCAFVGATGSGKSSLIRLIFRFYDPTSGAIRIDDQDIHFVTQRSLRKAIGMVPQDTVLFNDTIMHNIRYGNIHASDADVFAAAEAACIHETIMTRFPKGYETVVGERGLRLSGGEKQRVAFARALLKNPPILVLDEATSALDTITERKIQAALESLRSKRTTLIVAHRLSTIADAHTIVVLRLGQVVEIGNHHQLLAIPNGLYAELWSKQLMGEDTAATTSEGNGSNHLKSAVASATATPTYHGHGQH